MVRFRFNRFHMCTVRRHKNRWELWTSPLALREPSSQFDAAGPGEVRSVLRWAPALFVPHLCLLSCRASVWPFCPESWSTVMTLVKPIWGHLGPKGLLGVTHSRTDHPGLEPVETTRSNSAFIFSCSRSCCCFVCVCSCVWKTEAIMGDFSLRCYVPCF